MSWMHYLQRLYSLDTLDTRFTISTKTPTKPAAVELQVDPARHSSDELRERDATRKSTANTQSSRWNTPEFYFYFFVILIIIPLMFKAVIEVSQESHPVYPRYAHLLSEGWIPGRKVDNSDAQYASFRDNIPHMILVVALHPLLRKTYDYICRADTYTRVPQPDSRPNGHLTQGLSALAAADARMEQRISFDIFFTSVFLAALHGFSAPKVVLILYLNYKMAKTLPKSYIPFCTWIFNISVLFANEIYRGYSYAKFAGFFFPSIPSTEAKDQDATFHWASTLDKYGGLVPRWEVLFNLTVLRLISFNMDYYWSFNQSGGSPIEKKQLDPSNLSERDRICIPAKSADFSFRNYFAYILYSPLYLTGPIITFNDFMSQSRYRPGSITRSRTALYGIRFLICLLAMELIIHFMYAIAISKSDPDWSVYTPFQLSMLGFFNLHHIWLKLLLPWRFFRFWSLLDGIDPPENMVRCMSNNYSMLSFWRGWHRSFNRWIVRYLYIPLGGSGTTGAWGTVRSIANYLAVFTFVALWHDLQLRLLMWGWLITFFVVPEIVAKMLFPRRKFKGRPTLYRMLGGIGAVGNILPMMAANLVGFAVGLDGLQGLVHGIVGSYYGVAFLVASCATLFVGAQVMFELREEELRRGINLKC
ncbi:glycerol uptake protein 1 [Patellaria atrata CBS 101060]|uniref:Glycerol uptake protein 1 n=1 Tax=Patellaria atrata CBS 101060 TaxID=1346257 RepID=A0A9P4S3U9_9PEZI|nr:glycerol uptake protein 1 [Patellaria atrata CBS 101060]